MSRRTTIVVLAALLPALVAGCSGDGRSEPATTSPTGFEFAVIGDFPYTSEQVPMFDRLVADVNDETLALTLHVGDIGSNACTDDHLRTTRAAFDRFASPLVYTPGDNEWTDCHQSGSDPLARLGRVREELASKRESFGRRTLDLDRQVPTHPENTRFTFGEVTFVGAHQVGSNDGLGRTPDSDAEHRARVQANQAWLRAGFEAATAARSRGVVVFIQANPDFERYAVAVPTGHTEFLRALEREVLAFGGPVLLVHGDTHTFRVDKPLLGPDRRRVERFTRLETFGSPDVHWSRVVVDRARPELFSFSPETVRANVVDHGTPR